MDVAMRSTEHHQGNNCPRCNKALQKSRCDACGAKGYTREWIFIERECRTCNGYGFRMQCPMSSHILEDLGVRRGPESLEGSPERHRGENRMVAEEFLGASGATLAIMSD
jgi:hypothetical protein